MMKQEETQWKGGLLGDEMGMGKTIQAVSLIMSDFPAQAPSLIVVPPVALMQWQNEIRDYTNGKLKVLLFHGSAVKKLSLKELETYNVIITSCKHIFWRCPVDLDRLGEYADAVADNTLEVTFRKQEKGLVRKDKEDELATVKVREDSLFHAIKFHRIVLDEAHNIKVCYYRT